MSKKVKMTTESEPIELTEAEFEELIGHLDEFEDNSIAYLCGTPDYRIVPNEDEEGNLVSTEEMQSAARQIRAEGSAVVYRIDKGKEVLYFEPSTGKTLLEVEGIH